MNGDPSGTELEQAIGAVVLISCLVLGMLYEAIAARKLGGPTEFSPHMGCLLLVVILSVVLGIFWGWLSTGIILLLSALITTGGGWSSFPARRGDGAEMGDEAEGERGADEWEEIDRAESAREKEADRGTGGPEPGWEAPSVVIPVDPHLDPRLSRLARSFAHFGFELYRMLAKESNAFFSPLSVAMALATIMPGARGTTREEIEAALLRHGTEEGGASDPPLSTSEGITVEELPGVIRDLVPQLLRSRRKDWLQDEATGQLREVERDSFRLHLATALFAQERYPLIPEYRTMLREQFRAELFSLDFADAAECAARINHWVDLKTEGKIRKLVSEGSVDPDTRLVVANAVYFLAATLQAMGLVTVFDRDASDLSGITDDPDGLYLPRVIHQARVKVDEQGTGAAAATIIDALACGVPEEEPEVIHFRVDRPFFFLIRCERNGATFFLGRVTDPS